MTNYTKTTDFAAKDSLPSGDSGKIIRGSEFETEFDNIATAVNSKSDANNPTFTGTVTIDGLTVNGNTILGNAATDTVTVTADIASNLIPSADDTYNLGAVGAEWNDLHVDGVAYIDTIDGAATSGDFTFTGASYNAVWDSSANSLEFADNAKATFGSGNDLLIWHDGSNSNIKDNGTGDLYLIASNDIWMQGANGETMLRAQEDGFVRLYYDNSIKLATTTTGIDVTGTVVSDGLTSSGNLEISNTVPLMDFMESDQTDKNTRLVSTNGDFEIRTLSDNKATQTKRFSVDNPTGDISFYEDTGTTAKFFWDASAESLGIGTSSPSYILDLQNATGGVLARFKDSDSSHNGIVIAGDTAAGWVGNNALTTGEGIYYQNSLNAMRMYTNGSERVRIDSNGNVGIGTTSPGSALEVVGRIATSGGSADIQSNLFGAGDGSETNPSIRNIGDSDTGFWFPAANTIGFSTAGSEAMRIDAGGRVGIGTDSPGTKQVSIVGSQSYGQLRLAQNETDNTDQRMALTFRQYDFDEEGFVGMLGFTNSAGNQIVIGGGTGDFNCATVIRFATANDGITTVGVDRARITNGGHFLVGKTVQDQTNIVGFEAKDDGLAVATTDGSQSLILNRKTSDGTVAEFRKNNVAVGTISAASTNVIYGNDTRGLKIEDSLIIPRDIDDTPADAVMDLGSSFSRFQDLFLSGGVYLGGNAAANKLDDYEEGTWTPVLSDGTNTFAFASGTYTKVGRIVTCVLADYNEDTSALSGDIKITGLPFTSSGKDQSQPIYFRDGGTAGEAIFGFIPTSSTEVRLVESRGAASGATNVTASANTSVFTTFIYQTA